MVDQTHPNVERSELVSRAGEAPIAIVGMACLMPDARSLPEFWDNILRKVDSITDVPQDRWDLAQYYDPNPFAKDKVYSKRGAFIPAVPFNPLEWGLPPNILHATDTTQLLSLVVAKDCLEDAGIDADSSYDRERIGVVLGIGGGQKLALALGARMQYPLLDRVLAREGVSEEKRAAILERFKAQYPDWEENSFPGLLGNVIAGRIANRLNLGGMNTVTDAACASSLSAVRIAVNELRAGHSDLMLAGAACTDNSVTMYMSFSKTPAFTRGQDSRPFDASSEGMLVGEGLGMVALKRLADAEAQGDRIYAVLRGVGASSDGRSKSIYAPRPEGQVRALKQAYDDAGFSPTTLGLIEAHGTGTMAGDLAELTALKAACGSRPDAGPQIALGSVKSQIGHLKAAAGIAGMIKAALALHQKVLPPTIHVDEPNPKLGLEQSPFYLSTETRPWFARSDGAPRRAGVSAFGFGGTNFHLALEEYVGNPSLPAATAEVRLHTPTQALLFSAATVPELLGVLDEVAAEFEGCRGRPDFVNTARCYPLRPVDDAHPRVALIASTAEDVVKRVRDLTVALRQQPTLVQLEQSQAVWYRASGASYRGRVAAVFPGQGSQYVNMGMQLARSFPPVRRTIEAADRAAKELGVPEISAVAYPPPAHSADAARAQEGTLRRTEHAQPAIGALSAGLFEVLRAAGFAPDYYAGHSFGEFTALWASGALDLATFSRLAVLRGQAMKARPDTDAGTMVAVIGDAEQIAAAVARFPSVAIANLNSPRQVVLGGPTAEINACSNALTQGGFRVVPLPVSAAFHTELVRHAQKPLADGLAAAAITPFQGRVYANSTGGLFPNDPLAIRALMQEQLLQPVRFKDQIEAMYADGARLFVEVGPKNVLSKLIAETLQGREHAVVSLNTDGKQDADIQLRAALAKLAVLGLPLEDPDRYQSSWRETNTWKERPGSIWISAPNLKSPKVIAAQQEAAVVPAGAPPAAAATQPVAAPATEVHASYEATETEAPAAQVATRVGGRSMAMSSQRKVGESASASAQGERSGEFEREVSTVRRSVGAPSASEWSSQALRTHEQYLDSHRAYVDGMMSLLRRQFEAAEAAPRDAATSTLQRALDGLSRYQHDALRVHASVLGDQSVLVSTSFGAPVHEPVRPSYLVGDRADVSAPPAALAEPVESTPRTALPTAKRPALSASIALTVQDQARSAQGEPFKSLEAAAEQPVPEAIRPAAAQAESSASAAAAPQKLTREDLHNLMLGIVVERTGYPLEMLQPEMDIESDLGIDSIKRVEILAAMRDRLPENVELDTSALAEMRTLADVVRYMETVLNATNGAAVPTVAESPVATGSSFEYGAAAPQLDLPAPAQAAAPEAARAAPELPVSAPSTGGAAQAQALQQLMLEVVAEKTGYASSMLEPTMDMESDLGIDSIKRVEILGAVQERFPNLPALDTALLAELRTLAEVAEYFERTLSTMDATATIAVLDPAISASATEKKSRELIGQLGAAPA